jgi:serine/threonine protein phosphatase PrpC
MSNRASGTEDHDITLPAGILAQTRVAPQCTSNFVIRYSAATHTGLVREHNEDDFIALEDFGVYVVADGMGGHNAGKVASGLCVGAVRDYFRADVKLDETGDQAEDLSSEARELVEALRIANRAIFDASMRRREYAGMGTTAVAARFFDDRVAVAHAGDSRVYLAREGRMCQVTIDHSLINFLYDLNREFEAQVAEAHMSNVIMRAVGLEPEAQFEALEFEIWPGDRMLLCSDGLSDLVNNDRISELLYSVQLDRDAIVHQLICDALAAGGRDNVTVMIVDVSDGLDADTSRRGDNDTQTLTLPMMNTEATTPRDSVEAVSEDNIHTPTSGVPRVRGDETPTPTDGNPSVSDDT